MQPSTARGFRFRIGSRRAVLFALTAFGCGFGCAGSGELRQLQLNRAFADIQVHEAAIERSRSTVTAEVPNCRRSCEASQTARGHERRLCALAHELSDADALLRCEQAQRVTAAVETHATSACGCQNGDA